MNSSRSASWLPIAGLLLVVVGALGWLLLGYAGNQAGRTVLPDAQGSTVDYVVDYGRRLTLEDLRQLPAERWRHWKADRSYVSTEQGDDVWLRVTVRNPGEQELRGVIENDDFFADRVDVWIDESGGAVRHLRSGETVPEAEKAIAGREVAWPLTVPARGERVVWVRVSNFFSAYAVPVWWPEEAAFNRAVQHSAQAEGIYLGGLLALLGYNVLLWLRLRAKDIGCYVLYLSTAAAFMALARAQGPAYGWALGSPVMENALVTMMALSGIFLTQFARIFLETARVLPRAERWMNAWCGVLLVPIAGAIAMPSWPWLDWMKWLVPAIGLTHAGLLGLAVAAWRAGVRQARYFVYSFGCLFAGLLPMVLVWLWHDLLRDAGMRGLMIGSALEMLLLSLAVADRFAQAQRQLVEETEQRRMIEETYAEELEVEVRERTQELMAANADKDRMLAVIGHDLRSPLTGLMRSADRAPGDFAREVTRTGRELLLLIEDLVVWARLRAGAGAPGLYPARAVVEPAVALHRALAEQGGTELGLAVQPDLRVKTDLVLAQTLVRNLLANALKFARSRVVLRVAQEGAGVRFTVGNDGPALSAEVAARFAAGHDEPLSATGGLGLRLCREICRALGNRLEAGTGQDGGTEFSFVLPSAPGANEKPIQ